MSVFKAYDIRGMYGSEITEDLARKIGMAFVAFTGAKNIALARDMRSHSKPLTEALVDGLTDAGANVTRYGLSPTPALYFYIAKFKHDAGIMVTASHNPAEYNGFKLSREQAIPISGDNGIKDIETLVAENKFTKAKKKGAVTHKDGSEDYLNHVCRFKRELRPLKVVVDASNGMGGLFAQRIFDRLGLPLIGINLDLDGSFPAHEANPLKASNMKQLQDRVLAEKADLGIMYDGDADRCAFVDNRGEIIPCDIMTALIGRDMLSREKGGIMYDLRSSNIVRETIVAHGGTPIEERVGHAFMKARLRRENGIFGGELSGHFYFRDNFFCDSGEIAMVSALNVLSAAKQPLHDLVQPLRCYAQSGEINFHVEDKAAMMKTLEEVFNLGEVSHLDGVTVRYPDWWFNVRPSNTEPALRLNVEARTQDTLATVLEQLYAVLGTPEA